ncbi:NAD-dependent epimerase/dehydratase family protein [Pyxidicoccus sp. MSG2]|uniref:NAD-dependent epimerase/dehydratase family protein n=1 Tax=Pyxidicoccus sp. MSG2 TaxID=2996790 RepID=UPI00226E0FDA|nr:NAD-dependent epimerase/dehydratase family protein [Pyxidicoccus sp. MSG2]MCY1018966.1 NAD-dependent epimerase/dehydratase family protein [Pyxidicoccus sp. MSG2]
MKVILFGATGMVGQGVLRECLLDDGVERVLTVGRVATGQQHAKLREIVHKDLLDYASIEGELAGYDACFFCLGVSSAGMKEADYARVTYEMPLAAARTLVKLNPDMTFIYVSGASTDSTEQGRVMWARVKGRAENALLGLPFKAKYMFRPAAIQPMHGIVSKTRSYRILYAVMTPLYPVLRALFPKYVTTTEKVGRAMLHVVRHGAPKPVLENADINALVQAAG